MDKNTAVLSWRLNKGIQFLISGPRAHLVFQTMQPVDAGSEIPKGFEISYQVIGNSFLIVLSKLELYLRTLIRSDRKKFDDTSPNY